MRCGDLARHAAIHGTLGGYRVRLAEDDERWFLQKAKIQKDLVESNLILGI